MPLDKQGFFDAVNKDGVVEADENGELSLAFEQEGEETEETTDVDPILSAEEETEEGEAATDDPSEDDPFADPEEERSKPPVEKRIDKLVAERNSARDLVIEKDKELARLEGQVELLEGTQEVLNKHYSQYEDPAGQMAFDADFLNHFEALSKGNSATAMNARAIAKQILDALDQGTTVTERNESSPSNVPNTNPVMDKLLKRDATRTINDSLPEGVRAIFKKGLTDFILSEVSAEDLVDFSKEQVLDAARDYAKREGFSTEDIYTQKAASKNTSKPSTSGPAGGKAETKTRKPRTDEDGKPVKPKSISEFNKNRENFLRELVGA